MNDQGHPDDMSTISRAPGWPPSPRRRRGRLIAAVAAGALVLVAATGVTTWRVMRPSRVPTAVATAPAPSWSSAFGDGATAASYPSPPASYASADELLEWLSKVGLACTDTAEHVDSPSIATSLIDCGDTLSVAVYASHRDAVRGLDALNVAGMPAYVAIGSNWTVNGDEAYVRLVVQRLGGEFHAT